MADLDIAERRLPQDGRIRLRLQNRQVDVRVSTAPTRCVAESVVCCAFLDKERGRISLTDLGMADEHRLELFLAAYRPAAWHRPSRPVRPGSRKTTTLYAAVELIRTGREKIITVEDPAEHELEGAAAGAGETKKVGVTFDVAQQGALLRQ